jgi:hypothetical protein
MLMMFKKAWEEYSQALTPNYIMQDNRLAKIMNTQST